MDIYMENLLDQRNFEVTGTGHSGAGFKGVLRKC